MMLTLTWRNPFSGAKSIDVEMRIGNYAAELRAINWAQTGGPHEWRPVTRLQCNRALGIDEFLDIAAWCLARLADPETARNEPELLRHAVDAGIERINGKPPEQWLRARQGDTAHRVPFNAW